MDIRKAIEKGLNSSKLCTGPADVEIFADASNKNEAKAIYHELSMVNENDKVNIASSIAKIIFASLMNDARPSEIFYIIKNTFINCNKAITDEEIMIIVCDVFTASYNGVMKPIVNNTQPQNQQPVQQPIQQFATSNNQQNVTAPVAEPIAANKAFGFDPSVFITQPGRQATVINAQQQNQQPVQYSCSSNSEDTVMEMLTEVKKRVISGKHTGGSGITQPDIIALHWLINNPKFNAELQARGATSNILKEINNLDNNFNFTFEVATPTNPIIVKFSSKKTYNDPVTGNVCYIYSIS